MAITQQVRVSHYATFKEKLIKFIGEDATDRLIGLVGGEASLMNATFSSEDKTGSAYEGSLIQAIFRITKYALQINKIFPENIRVSDDQIVKVCLLQHISKAIMLKPNDSTWEKQNRGIMFKWIDLPGALRSGERSILLCMQAGIPLNEIEYEAMRIMDKDTSEDKFSKMFSSVLSTIVRQANEIVTLSYDKLKDIKV